jgi:hypothetical protein
VAARPPGTKPPPSWLPDLLGYLLETLGKAEGIRVAQVEPEEYIFMSLGAQHHYFGARTLLAMPYGGRTLLLQASRRLDPPA